MLNLEVLQASGNEVDYDNMQKMDRLFIAQCKHNYGAVVKGNKCGVTAVLSSVVIVKELINVLPDK